MHKEQQENKSGSSNLYSFEEISFRKRFFTISTLFHIGIFIFLTLLFFSLPFKLKEGLQTIALVLSIVALIFLIILYVNRTKNHIVKIKVDSDKIELTYLHFNRKIVLEEMWSDIEVTQKQAIDRSYIPILFIKIRNKNLNFFPSSLNEHIIKDFDQVISEVIAHKSASGIADIKK